MGCGSSKEPPPAGLMFHCPNLGSAGSGLNRHLGEDECGGPQCQGVYRLQEEKVNGQPSWKQVVVYADMASDFATKYKPYRDRAAGREPKLPTRGTTPAAGDERYFWKTDGEWWCGRLEQVGSAEGLFLWDQPCASPDCAASIDEEKAESMWSFSKQRKGSNARCHETRSKGRGRLGIQDIRATALDEETLAEAERIAAMNNRREALEARVRGRLSSSPCLTDPRPWPCRASPDPSPCLPRAFPLDPRRARDYICRGAAHAPQPPRGPAARRLPHPHPHPPPPHPTHPDPLPAEHRRGAGRPLLRRPRRGRVGAYVGRRVPLRALARHRNEQHQVRHAPA